MSSKLQISFLDALNDSPSVLPAGYRNNDGNFNNQGNNANLWSASENNSNNAYNQNFNNDNANVNQNNNNKNNGFSLRCLQDSIFSSDASMAEGSFTPSRLFFLLLKAYKDARKNKRNTYNQLKFEANYERELMDLALSILNRTYEISPSICFVNESHVKREIVAANFKDRVVHHLLFNLINPIVDKKFIYDCYSCRKGKGTLFGIYRAQSFARSVTDNFTTEGYVLRLDISGFFMNINRDILYAETKRLCECNSDLVDYLLKKFIYHNPLENCIFRSPPTAWEGLPKNKSLRYSPSNCGLPIGNLTSQLFGNVYLNPLDQFVKRRLGAKCYGRYVDDMMLFSKSRDFLRYAAREIRHFLKGSLFLDMHPKKVYLQSVHHGFDFLGNRVLPNRLYANDRLRKNFLDSVGFFGQNPLGVGFAHLASYDGFFSKMT